MIRNSFAKAKRGLAYLEGVEITATLAQEKVALAEFLEQETELEFGRAQDLIEIMCDELLPGYRGVDKLFVFRSRIRDRLTDYIRRRHEIDNHNDWLDQQETLSDARNSGCP